MADGEVNGPAPAAPEQGGGGEPAPNVLPEGHEAVPADELNRLRANASRVQGMDGFYRTAREKGFDTEDALRNFDRDEYEALVGLKSQIGDLDKLKSMVALMHENGEAPPSEGQQGQQPVESLSREDIERMFEERETLGRARSEHDSTLKEDMEAIMGLKGELFGDEPDEFNSTLFDLAAEQLVNRYRWGHKDSGIEPRLYPEGHPLREHDVAPLGPEGREQAAKFLKDLHAKMKGANLEKAGTAPRKPKATAGGAPAGGQGKPGDDEDSIPRGLGEEVKARIQKSQSAAALSKR